MEFLIINDTNKELFKVEGISKHQAMEEALNQLGYWITKKMIR